MVRSFKDIHAWSPRALARKMSACSCECILADALHGTARRLPASRNPALVPRNASALRSSADGLESRPPPWWSASCRRLSPSGSQPAMHLPAFTVSLHSNRESVWPSSRVAGIMRANRFQSNFATTDVSSHVEVVDGRICLRPEGTEYSAETFRSRSKGWLGDPRCPQIRPVRCESRRNHRRPYEEGETLRRSVLLSALLVFRSWCSLREFQTPT
jgi:hypothetical protein